MNKSLAQRVGEHTIKVIKEQEAENKKRIKTKVLEILTNTLKEKGQNGSRLFTSTPNELDIDIDNILESEDYDDVQLALREIGFEFIHYPMRSIIRIPQDRTSNEIKELLKVYDQALESFANSEKEKSKKDCQIVLKMLEKKKYEVKGICELVVNFVSSSNTSYYEEAVKGIMKDEHFEVKILHAQWYISVILKEDD